MFRFGFHPKNVFTFSAFEKCQVHDSVFMKRLHKSKKCFHGLRVQGAVGIHTNEKLYRGILIVAVALATKHALLDCLLSKGQAQSI